MDREIKGTLADSVASGARSLGTLALALLFAYLGAMLGNMAYPRSMGALVGGFFGFLAGGVIGFFVTAKYKEYLEDAYEAGMNQATLVPDFMAEGVFGHPAFTLFVTVHYLEDKGEDRSHLFPGPLSLFPTNADFYIRVKCGRNPVKNTSVKPDGKFNETFKLVVEPQDRSLCFELTDQDVFSEDLLGQISVPTDEIFNRLQQSSGLIRDDRVRLFSEKTKAGVLVVTYRCGDDTRFDQRVRPAGLTGYVPNNTGTTAPGSVYNSRAPQQPPQYGTFTYFDSSHPIHPSALVPPSHDGVGTFGAAPYHGMAAGPSPYGSHGHPSGSPYASQAR